MANGKRDDSKKAVKKLAPVKDSGSVKAAANEETVKKSAVKTQVGTEPGTAQQEFNADMKLEYINNSKPKIQFVAAIAYLLFFIPLIFYPNERFARFHANQGLLFLLFTLAAYAVSVVIYFVWQPLGLILLPLTFVISLLFISLGICNASAGKAESLPFFGALTIIKTDRVEPEEQGKAGKKKQTKRKTKK